MRKANPTTLGIFLVVGFVLGVAGLVIFSSGTLFRPQVKSILYFDGSLKGLNPGAPVKFRGVTIGRVDQILIRHNQAVGDYAMPVIIAIDNKLAQSKSDERLRIGDRARLSENIRLGFRGRLDAESLVTGVLYVSLDFLTNAPPPVFHQLRLQYNEIPTIPSQVQQLLATLEHLDLNGISVKLNSVLARLDTGLSQVDVPRINSTVISLIEAANQVIATPDLTNSIVALRRALSRADKLLERIDGRVDPLADSLTNTLAEAQKALGDLRQAVQNISDLTGPDAAFRIEFNRAVEQLGNASRSVADFAEFLERNPDALLTGRKRAKEQQ